MKLYLRILRYLRPYVGLLAVAILGMITFSALDALSFTLLIPFLNVLFHGGDSALAAAELFGSTGRVRGVLQATVGPLVDSAAPMDALRNVVLLMFGVFLVKNIALYVQTYSVAVIQAAVTRDLRDDIYAHLVRLDFAFFQSTRVGQVISRLTADVDQLRTLVTSNLAQALSSLIQVVVFVVLLFLISWKLTLVALVALPVMGVLWGRFRKRLRKGVLRVLNAVGELASHVQETASGIRLVKASGAEAWETERFRRLTHMHYKATVRNERWRKFFPPATEMISAVAVLALLWFGSFLVLEERSLGASTFLLALVGAMRLLAPAKWLGQFPAVAQPGLAAAERAFELLDQPVEIADRPGARPVRGFREALRLEGLGFAYEAGEPTLEGIDLTIRPGEVVALVGASGAGKSTLADLLPRFQEATTGRVLLDGIDVRELRLGELRSLFGIVTQETILFHATVRENIAYGVAGATEEQVRAAARAANAAEFIEQLPDGYETMLGERGVRLSGGQRQRVAIARALLRNPPILILDEATSALDTQSERLVQQAIDELLHDRTVIVIAHRLSTVRRADQIVVLDRGRIVERGTHEQLLARRGAYHRLYALQFAGSDSRELSLSAAK